jgi:sigma-B regulation protein RsbU (phosphoserine phosphatase)
VFYTDGITEATNRAGEQFGIDRLDSTLLNCPVGARNLVEAILHQLELFTEGLSASDDRTLLTAAFSLEGESHDSNRSEETFAEMQV